MMYRPGDLYDHEKKKTGANGVDTETYMLSKSKVTGRNVEVTHFRNSQMYSASSASGTTVVRMEILIDKK